MMDTLGPRPRRALALTLTAWMIAILYLGVIRPVIGHFTDREDNRESALRSLARDRALLKQALDITHALQSVSESPRRSRFYEGHKPAQATLQLEGDVRALIALPNQPSSMIAEPSLTQGPLTRLSVKITLSVSIDQLTGILVRLSQQSRFLKIESFTVQAPDYQAVDSNPILSVQAQIAGFMLTPATAAL